MPPIKLEVISHDVKRGRTSNEYGTNSWDFDSHTMRAKLISVLPEQVRSYGFALHCIMMLLYIPYLVDTMHVARVHGVDTFHISGYITGIFHKPHVRLTVNSNPCLQVWSIVVSFIVCISFGFAFDLLRSIVRVFSDYEQPYMCSGVGTQFGNNRPIIDFAKLEVTFYGEFNYNFDHLDERARMYKSDPNNARKFEPGEQFEIDLSPVQYMCLFKQENNPDDDPV